MSTQREGDNGWFLGALLLPAIIVGGVSSVAAMSAVRSGGNWLIAKLLSWLPAMFFTQYAGACLFVSFGWVIAFFAGSRDMANWIFESLSNFALLPLYAILFNHSMHFDLEPARLAQTVIYQFILWLVIGRPALRAWTCAMYDWGLCRAADDRGVHPVILRREALEIDPGYYRAAAFYANRRKMPFFSMVLVGLCGNNPMEYF